MSIATHVALALTIAGGVIIGGNRDPSKIKSGVNLRHIGAVIFLIVFIQTVLVTVYLWMNQSGIMKHRQTVSAFSCSDGGDRLL